MSTSPYLGEWENYENELQKIKDVRLICQIENTGTDPYFIQNLLETNLKIQMRCCKDIHAKVYLGDSTALLGSANLTKNGMGAGTIEATMIINEKKKLDILYIWFEEIWKNLKDDPRTYDKKKWDGLKEKWNNRERQSTKESWHFSDELRMKSKDLRNNFGFIFWDQRDNSTSEKKDIFNKVKENNPLLNGYSVDDLEILIELEGKAKNNKTNRKQLSDFFKNHYGKPCILIEVPSSETWIGTQKFIEISRIASPFVCYQFENNFVGIYRKIGKKETNLKFNDKDKNRKFIELMNNSLSFSKLGWEKIFKKWENDAVEGFLDAADLSKLLFK